MSLLVQAVNQTISRAAGNGKITKEQRPGMIILTQSHGDKLNWQPHVHAIISDGFFDYRNKNEIIFHPMDSWDIRILKQLFQRTLLTLLVKKEIITEGLANNLLSWRHSGFGVHASESFEVTKTDELIARLSYAHRVPVAVNRVSYTNNLVYYETKNGEKLEFHPLDFIAYVTLHIPNHYQNIVRYCGFYASRVQRLLPKEKEADEVTESKPALCVWVQLISKVFGEIPIQCPRCKALMKLDRFVTTGTKIDGVIKALSWIKRAPPRIQFPKFDEVSESIEYNYDEQMSFETI
jgi:hypothetical protein